jgi:ADP-L-glycero-D-manno-heptose 6-epimerase
LAAISSTRDDPIVTLKNNLCGFLNIIDFALKGKKKTKLIYASSAAVYGKYKKTAYAISKITGDEIAEYFFDKMPIVGIRPFNVFGPNEIQKGWMASMITQWTLQIKNGQRPKAFGSERKSKRDHIYVKDGVKAFIQAIKLKNGIYDMGTGKPRTYDDVLNAVQKALGTNIKPTYIKNPFKSAYQRFTKADVSWGFKADYTLEQGVKDYLEKNFPYAAG